MNKINSNPETKVLTTSGVGYSSLNLRTGAEPAIVVGKKFEEGGGNLNQNESPEINEAVDIGRTFNDAQIKNLEDYFKRQGFSKVELSKNYVFGDTDLYVIRASDPRDGNYYITKENAEELLFKKMGYPKSDLKPYKMDLDNPGNSLFAYKLDRTPAVVEKLKAFAGD